MKYKFGFRLQKLVENTFNLGINIPIYFRDNEETHIYRPSCTAHAYVTVAGI